MTKVKTIEEFLKVRFAEVYGRFCEGELNTEEASSLLFMSSRTFLRKRNRYEEEDFDGNFDRRLGKKSGRRASDEEVEDLCQLFEDRYADYNVRHFHNMGQRYHGLKRSYSWVKQTLFKKGIITKSTRGGKHRLRRPRRPMSGMMIHQDASKHLWIEGLGHPIDLVVTMDDATSEITSALFVEEEGTESSLHGIEETIMKHGLFCSLYTDRGTHYFHTPKVGGKIAKGHLTHVGLVLKKLGIQHIAAYSPQARGRSERMFGTLQGRLPQELKTAGIKTLAEANRYLKEVYLPAHNTEFMVKAEDEKSAYIPWAGGSLRDVMAREEERLVGNDNTIGYKGMILQLCATTHRHHYVKTKVKIKEYRDGLIDVCYGNHLIASYNRLGQRLEEIKLVA